ncbi:hypothetical protein INT46_008704 [Mucor plumbeus]|uniref:Uncharacterized protein n=1 Tax=Mucor plumbeus TaxID=97098 RepID=A0A8H7QQU1_9FUNG|nr:hypothetical protein INT46_008704 [Mucor plumbeus]
MTIAVETVLREDVIGKNNGLGALPNTVKNSDIRDDNDNKEPRFWCKDNIIWTLDNWKRMIITGELRVYHFNSDG